MRQWLLECAALGQGALDPSTATCSPRAGDDVGLRRPMSPSMRMHLVLSAPRSLPARGPSLQRVGPCTQVATATSLLARCQ
jgi:hypothetical protein